MKKRFLIVLAFLAASIATAVAETYPSRPITIVVPFPAGGPTDTLARILVDHMRASLGQSVIIENVSGGGGSVGVGRVARAAPDGYTVSIGHWSTHVVNGATVNAGVKLQQLAGVKMHQWQALAHRSGSLAARMAGVARSRRAVKPRSRVAARRRRGA
jgi:tripartite-type tricarboxylate transporter receptor subunit TctC